MVRFLLIIAYRDCTMSPSWSTLSDISNPSFLSNTNDSSAALVTKFLCDLHKQILFSSLIEAFNKGLSNKPSLSFNVKIFNTASSIFLISIFFYLISCFKCLW